MTNIFEFDALDFGDIDFGFGPDAWGEHPPNSTPVTSDKFAEQAKQFMSSALIDRRNVKNKTFVIIGNALRDITLPEPGQMLRIRTQTQFSMLSFVLKIVHQHEVIDELTIATYTLNSEAFSVISDLVRSGKIARLNLLIASSYSYRDPSRKRMMTDAILEMSKAGSDVHLVFVWTHLKITLARCGRDHYLIEGSMNYSMNNMAEQVLFENDETSYNFDYRFILDTMTSDDNNQALEIVC